MPVRRARPPTPPPTVRSVGPALRPSASGQFPAGGCVAHALRQHPGGSKARRATRAGTSRKWSAVSCSLPAADFDERRNPSGADEEIPVLIGDGKEQREIAPFVIVDQMGIGAAQRRRNRVAAGSQIHRKRDTKLDRLAVLELL